MRSATAADGLSPARPAGVANPRPAGGSAVGAGGDCERGDGGGHLRRARGPGGPPPPTTPFCRRCSRGPTRGQTGEGGHLPPLRQDPLRFPTLGRKLRDRRLLGGVACFFAEEIPSCAGAFGKASAMGRVWNIPFDTVKARPANCAKGGTEEGGRMLGAYRLELQLSHPLCAGGVLQRKQGGNWSCEAGSGLQCRGQRGIPMTYMRSQIDAERGRWQAGRRCGNGWAQGPWRAVPARDEGVGGNAGLGPQMWGHRPCRQWALDREEKRGTLNLLN